LSGCKASHAGVLGRPRTFGYAASLRPWPARFSHGRRALDVPERPLASRLEPAGRTPRRHAPLSSSRCRRSSLRSTCRSLCVLLSST